jgi:parvulin-like peptidyl-prolyl isomerase
MAEKEKLDLESPAKETLNYYRMLILSQTKIQDVVNKTTVAPAEIVKFYDQSKERYKQVHVRAIYVAYSVSPQPSSKALTEEQAKGKAEKLVADLKGGADFGKLARAESDDQTSREKDGDFATLRANDTIPDAIKAAVFALKQGETSAPVKQPNGFYIFRAEEVTYRPLSQVRDEIYAEIKDRRSKEWMDQANKDSKVQFNNPAFLGQTAGKAK